MRLRLMPLTGGTPRNFPRREAANLAWSPDGERIVYHTFGNGDPCSWRTALAPMHGRYSGTGREFTTIFQPGRLTTVDLFRAWDAGDEGDGFMAHRSGRGNPERLTQRNTDIAYPTPVGNRTVFYVARAATVQDRGCGRLI